LENKRLIFLIGSDQIILLELVFIKSSWTVASSNDFVFQENEIIDGVIYNNTMVADVIGRYLSKNGLLNLPGHVVFTDKLLTSGLVEKIGLQNKFDSDPEIEFALSDDKKYWAQIKPELLLQYQLLFLTAGVYIEIMTGQTLILLRGLSALDRKKLSAVKTLDQLCSEMEVFGTDLYAKLAEGLTPLF